MADTKSLTAGQQASEELSALIRARNSVIRIEHPREEGRVERGIIEACGIAQMEPVFWSCDVGFVDAGWKQVREGQGVQDPSACLRAIEDAGSRIAFVLRDFDSWCKDPTILRKLKSLGRILPTSPRDKSRVVILLSSEPCPSELKGIVVPMDWPLPDRAEITRVLENAINGGLPESKRKAAAQNGTFDKAVDGGLGLTEEEAGASYRKSLVTTSRSGGQPKIVPEKVAEEKRRVVKGSGVEWYNPLEGGLDSVAGLERLKEWLKRRRASFSVKARAYGLPSPKGMLLVGVQGCGKSLTSKAVSTAWEVPLLRLDLGALQSKWVGESQGNIRKALKMAETVAPCVLWLDEIEKAFAGATSGAADGGVSMDALGTILTWMQEKTAPVFVIATSNNIEGLPPELLRKGRFDEIFFVDLPTRKERKSILQVTMKQYKRSEVLDLDTIVEETKDFIGAEVSELVVSAMHLGFSDGARPITTEDFILAAEQVVPLAKMAGEKIEKLRKWAKGRARMASDPEEGSDSSNARVLDL